MPVNIRKYSSSTLFFVAVICLACYLVIRTYCVDITDDEAWSYYNVKNFWWVEVLCSGNTHWFNFLAIKTVLLLGWEKAWDLRWFSLLCGISYLFITFRWTITFGNVAMKVLGFALLCLNPYVIEYLTLARGYATGLCFMVMSLYFYFRPAPRLIVSFPLLFAGMSALANFNFFYFFSALSAYYFCQCYYKEGVHLLKRKDFYLDIFFTLSIAGLILRALWFIRQCSNDIGSFGGEDLINSIFGSYLDTLFYGQFYFPETIRYVLALFLFIVVLFAALYGLLAFKFHHDSFYRLIAFVLLGMLVLVIFNNWAFNVLYPTERTSLMFYPIMSLVFTQLLVHAPLNYFLRQAIAAFISTILIINFLKTVRTESGYDHAYCLHTEPYFKYLSQLPTKNVGLAVEVYFVYLKYYRYTTCSFNAESINEYRINPRYLFNHRLQDFDHLLLLPPYNLKYYKTAPVYFTPVKYFPHTGALIVKVNPR